MLLCYLSDFKQPQLPAELFLVPEKFDPFAAPALVRSLRPTYAGVHRLSTEETFVVAMDEEDGHLVVTPMEPTALYLTPNLNAKPGFRTRKIKYFVDADGHERILYFKERGGWEEWVATTAKV